jgi:hypothetical protein
MEEELKNPLEKANRRRELGEIPNSPLALALEQAEKAELDSLNVRIQAKRLSQTRVERDALKPRIVNGRGRLW